MWSDQRDWLRQALLRSLTLTLTLTLTPTPTLTLALTLTLTKFAAELIGLSPSAELGLLANG